MSLEFDDVILWRFGVPYVRRNRGKIRKLIRESSGRSNSLIDIWEQMLDSGVMSLEREGNYSLGGMMFPEWDFIPRFSGSKMYFTQCHDASFFLEVMKGIQIYEHGEYTTPPSLKPRDWMVIRKKDWLYSGSGLNINNFAPELLRREILTSKRIGSYSVFDTKSSSNERRIFPLVGRTYYYVNEKDALLLRDNLAKFFEARYEVRQEAGYL